jgi:ABC-type amino acid transport substrate-binding protein
MNKRFLLFILTAMLLLVGTALTACGDDDDDDSGGGGTETTAGAELDLIKDGTLTVASDIPYPPFEQGDPPDYEGFDIDLINEIATRLDLETEIKDLPFDALLQGQSSGRYDLAIAATTSSGADGRAREKKVDFSDPYFNAEQSLLVRKDGDIRSIDDVTSDTIIGAQDATTGERYAQENTDADVRPFQETDDAYQGLANGQIDAVMNDLPSTDAAVKDNPDLEVVDTFDTKEEYGIIFAEDQDALREQINVVLQEIKDDGTLNELYQKWFQTDAPESLLKATHDPT